MRLGDGEVTSEPQALREDRQANAATDWLNQLTHCTPAERALITKYIRGRRMKINEYYKGKYINAEDVRERPVRVVISDVIWSEDMGKPIVFFEGAKKSLAVNVTNKDVLVQNFGDETDAWLGQTVILYAAATKFEGKSTIGVRIRVEHQMPAVEEPANPSPAEDAEDIPF